MWMSWVANQSSAQLGRQLVGVPADVGQRRLGRLAHHVAELAGDRQLALAGHGARLDEQHLAADRGPGEAGGDARHLRAARALGEEAPLAEQLARPLGGDPRPCPRPCPRRPRGRPCGRSVPISRSRLRTPASRVYSSMIAVSAGVGELELRGLEPVGLELAGDEVAAWRCGASRPPCSRRAGSPPSGPGGAAGSCRGCSPWR